MTDGSDLQTLLVGIDAACDRVLAPLFEDDALPTLESIYADGVGGPLTSQIPPWTASAWPSLYTGMNPGKHGIYSFLDFDGYEWEVVNATHIRERTLWEVLDRHDLTSVVVNAPVTFPPRAFDGALIPGYTAPENPDCHPDGLLAEVREAIGEYHVYPRDETGDGHRESYTDCVRTRGEAFRYLAERFEPDFGFVQFQVTDSVFHKRPEDDEAIRAIYREVDRQLGALLETCEPRNVVVASDHGMGPYDGYEFRVNEFLRRNGYVETENGGRGMPSWATVRERNLKRGEAAANPERGITERAVATAASLGLTSQRIGAVLDRIGIGELVSERVPASVVGAGSTQVDFPESVAYVRSRIELGIRINLEGREPEGIVPPEEYETVRDRLVDELQAVTTPDGEPVFDEVVPREEYFHGPESDDAVDVVTVPADFEHFLSATLRDEQFGSPPEPWNHKLEGTFAARGADVDPAAHVGDAHLFDVTPTILATLDVPVDERMDGEPLPCVASSDSKRYPRPAEPSQPQSRTEPTGGQVAERLADLGYIER